MYDYLKGSITYKAENYVVLENDGVGYKLYTSLRTHQLISVSKDALVVFVYQHVREDELTLYGFLTRYERDVFLALLAVSGVGPKLALKILTEVEPALMVQTIFNEDLDKLKAIKGLGAKTAGKVLLELKGKIDHLAGSNGSPSIDADHSNVLESTRNALKNLGYREGEIKQVMGIVFKDKGPKTLEEAIKETLRILSK